MRHHSLTIIWIMHGLVCLPWALLIQPGANNELSYVAVEPEGRGIVPWRHSVLSTLVRKARLNLAELTVHLFFQRFLIFTWTSNSKISLKRAVIKWIKEFYIMYLKTHKKNCYVWLKMRLNTTSKRKCWISRLSLSGYTWLWICVSYFQYF